MHSVLGQRNGLSYMLEEIKLCSLRYAVGRHGGLCSKPSLLSMKNEGSAVYNGVTL